MGVERTLCPYRRQRRGRELRAKWPGVAGSRAQRRGDLPARPSAAAVKVLSSLGERLGVGLRRSREFLSSELQAVFEPDRPIDEALYTELEETLIAADLGAPLAADFVNRAREEVMFGTVTRAEQLRPLFRKFLTEILAPAVQPLDLDRRATVACTSLSCSSCTARARRRRSQSWLRSCAATANRCSWPPPTPSGPPPSSSSKRGVRASGWR